MLSGRRPQPAQRLVESAGRPVASRDRAGRPATAGSRPQPDAPKTSPQTSSPGYRCPGLHPDVDQIGGVADLKPGNPAAGRMTLRNRHPDPSIGRLEPLPGSGVWTRSRAMLPGTPLQIGSARTLHRPHQLRLSRNARRLLSTLAPTVVIWSQPAYRGSAVNLPLSAILSVPFSTPVGCS